MEQALAALCECRDLFAQIDAAGGPAPGTEEHYEHARSWVNGHLTALQDHELGLDGLFIGSLVGAPQTGPSLPSTRAETTVA